MGYLAGNVIIDMGAKGVLSADESALVVVDVQEKFRPAIDGWDGMVAEVVKLIKGCKILGVPVIATEQYPKGLGRTVSEVREVLDCPPVEKTSFSCFGDALFRDRIALTGRRQLLLCGIEAHVCVLNTALDALSGGYEVHYVVDATSSRKRGDKDVAVERVKQSGAYLATTEMALFQLLKGSKAGGFKEISVLVK